MWARPSSALGRARLLGPDQARPGLAAGVFVDEDVDEDEIENLKQGDMLESSFGEFAKQTLRCLRR